MRRVKANRNQIFRNIAMILLHNPAKVEQLRRVQSICENLTSSDGVDIECELYSGNIARYLIRGVRASMTITANTTTYEIVRKRRGEQPWLVADVDCYCYEIFDMLDAIAW